MTAGIIAELAELCRGSAPRVEQILAPWRQVADKADAFFAQTAARCGEAMRCAPGCTACCGQDLEVLVAEGLALLRGLARLPDPRSHAAPDDACALLGADGLCLVYGHRPVICRTHGLALRRPDAPGGWVSCELNFTGRPPPADGILNETLLTAGLTVADSLVRQALSIAQPARLSIRAILEQGS
jgi:hypothetical protein